MGWRQWGIGKRSSRRGDPTGSPGAREISDWLESSSPAVEDDDEPNPYLPPGTPPTWAQASDEALLGAGSRGSKRRRRGKRNPEPSGTEGGRGASKRRARGASGGAGASSSAPRPTLASSRPSTSSPTAAASGPATARRRPTSGYLVVVALVLALIGGGIWFANRDRPPGDLGGPAVPNADPTRAELVDLDPVWEAYPSDVVYGGIGGGSYDTSPFVVTPETVVVRRGEDLFEDSEAYALMALWREDGNIAWELELDGVICATELLHVSGAVAHASEAEEVVVCAGNRPADAATDGAPAGERLLFLNPTTGRIGLDQELDAPPASIATATQGLVVQDRLALPGTAGASAAGEGAVLGLHWFDATGRELWAADAVEVSGELADRFVPDDPDPDDPEPKLYKTEWTRYGDALLVAMSWNALVLDAAGPHVLLDDGDRELTCGTLAPAGASLVCADGWRATQVVADPATGDWREGWVSEVGAVGAERLLAPLLLGEDSEDDVTAVMTLDPATGAAGAELARLRGYYIRLHGTREVPVLRGSDALVVLAPDGGSALWRRGFDSDYGGLGLFVAGDRVVLPDYSPSPRQDVVLDAADGHEVARITEGTLWPVEGRQVLSLAYDGVRLIELP